MRSISSSFPHRTSLLAASAALLLAACSSDAGSERVGESSSASVTELAWNYVNTVSYKTVQQLAVAPEADGRVTLFVLYTDGTVYRATQNSPSGGWVGAPVDMGAHSLLQIAVIPNADGRLEVFALGGDRAVYHVWETSPNGAWGAWATEGGTQLQSVTVARNADGRLQLFAIGGDHAVYTMAQTPSAGSSFGGWQYLGGSQIQSLQPAPNQNGALNLFAIGGDHLLYSMTQSGPNGAFGAWTRPLFDNTTIDLVAPIANLDGRLELVVHRTDGEMMHSWQTSPNGPFYASYYDYGVDNVTEFAPASEADGRIVLFMVQNKGLYTLSQVAANGGWANHLGSLAFSGVNEVHVAAGNGLGGAIRLFTSTGYNTIGQLDEAGPNGPWETNQVNPLAQLSSFDVPSQVYVGQGIPISWTLSTDPYCTPQVHISATEGPHNTVLFNHVYTTTSGTATISGAMLGTVEVGAVPSCTNGAAGKTVIKQVQIVSPPPSACGAGQPPPKVYPFCTTFTSGLFAGQCWLTSAPGCSEAAAEALMTSEEPSDAIVKQESSCPADCNQ